MGQFFAGIFLPPFLELKANFGQRGSAYANTSSSHLSRTSSNTDMNCSIVSQSTTLSSPCSEYRQNLRATGSTTQRERKSSCMGSSVYLLIIRWSGVLVNLSHRNYILRQRIDQNFLDILQECLPHTQLLKVHHQFQMLERYNNNRLRFHYQI